MTGGPQHHIPAGDLVDLCAREVTAEEREHLAACARCRSEQEAYRATLATLAPWAPPARSATYGAEVWRKLAPRMRRRKTLHTVGWAAAAAAVLALAAGLATMGKRGREVREPHPVTAVAPARADALLDAALREHAERTGSLLREIEQTKPSRVPASVKPGELADLIAESRIYRQTAEQQDARGAASLLEETESVLVALEHASRSAPAHDIKAVQERIARTGLAGKLSAAAAREPEPQDKAKRDDRGTVL